MNNATAPTSTQTFGIELELLCLRPAILPPAMTPNRPSCEEIADAVLDALIRHGVPVSDHTSDDINDNAPPYSQWRIEPEVLDLSPQEQLLLPEGYVVEAIELISRKFYPGHEDWRSEILAVLDALRELEGYGVKFLTNESTGFHVHVGYHEHSVPLRTAKNVFLFAAAFEAQLDELHSAPRIAVPVNAEKRHHCHPLSFFLANKCGMGSTVYERLQFVERAASYEQLGSIFFVSAEEMGSDEDCTGHNSAYNFDNLFPNPELDRHAETLTGTVEFRQHAGTLDYNAIVAWVETTTAIVRYAAETEMEDLLEVLMTATSERTGLGFLAEMIVLPDEVSEYHELLTNGTLVVPAPETTDAHTPLIPLLSSNWAYNTARSSRALVAQTILQKFAQGFYGHDPNRAPFEVQEEDVQDLVQFKKAECLQQGIDAGSEGGISFIAEWVLRHMARHHRLALNRAQAL